MPKKIKPDAFRKALSSELLMYVDVLNRNASEVFLNPDVLKQAANRCKVFKPLGENSWGYDVSDLQFKIKRSQKVFPSFVGSYLSAHLDCKIHGVCSDDLTESIQLLELNIVVFSECGRYISSWHFDKHVVDDNQTSHPEDAHPLYHFQYGGNRLSQFGGDYGNMLLMPAPRIGHPPMDIVLAIDFMLSNFAGVQWQLLRNMADYKVKINNAQDRFWKPYFEHLSEWWSSRGRRDPKAFSNELWPSFLCD